MKHSPRILLFALLLATALGGCSQQDFDPAAPDSRRAEDPGDALKSAPDLVTINGHVVRFDGREFAGGQTTFSYTVVPEDGAPLLERFMLEAPDCAGSPDHWFPASGFISSYYGLVGVKWNTEDGQGAPERVFTVTFDGDVPLGMIQALVGVNGAFQSGMVYGPCAGLTVAGTVFIDTDFDGVRDLATEPGLPDVTVEVEGPGGDIVTVTTGADGRWTATAPGATVTVRIDLLANPSLADYYEATTTLERNIVVEQSVMGVDFGFAPLTTEIIDAVETGVLPSNGEDRKFWRQQFKRALVRDHRRDDHANGPGQEYDGAELLALLDDLQALYYEDPFVFTPGNELREAYELLQRRPRTRLEELRQELFVTELNHVAGLGLWGANMQFQADIIGWGESVVIQTVAEQAAKATPQLLEQAIGVFRAINTGGGGIIDE